MFASLFKINNTSSLYFPSILTNYNMLKKCTLLLISLFIFGLGWGQNDYRLKIQGADFIPANNATQAVAWTASNEEIVNGKVYRIWQFEEIPTQNEWDRLESLEVTRLFYLPEKAFLVSVPVDLTQAQARPAQLRAILPWKSDFKADESVANGEIPSWSWAGDDIRMTVEIHEDIAFETAVSDLGSRSFSPSDFRANVHALEVQFAPERLQELLALPFVSWAEPVDEPAKPEDNIGKSLHRSNAVVNRNSGVPYNGEGVKVLVRDDGAVGPHIDFQGRLENLSTQFNTFHGDLVGGAMAGAGNLDPTVIGSAPHADVFALRHPSFSNFNGPTLSLHRDSNVVITNTSYSNGCNRGYTSLTQILDGMLYDNPTLMHVFSSGNDGASDCGYGAGSRWGNITGGHKVGKNVLAVGNVNDFGIIAGSSSRGPARDGRIKPEVTANGVNFRGPDENNTFQQATGTSFSAPAAAGVMAQLYHAYRDIHNAEPTGALIKNILMNSADDAGNPGPDFIYGFGVVNGFKGYKIIEEGRFFSDSVSHLESKSHTIEIPQGIIQLKVMVYWPDRAAFPGANKDLVDDIDCILSEPTGAAYTALVLDSSPSAASLNLNAAQNLDQLNNMEQMVIDLPAGGDYTLDIIGSNITNGKAPYYVTYEFIQPEIDVTYPSGGEHFVPGETEVLRWDAPQTTSPFSIYFNSGEDTVWRIVSLSVNSNVRHFSWNIPNNFTITDKAKIRIESSGLVAESPETFNIMSQTPNVWISRVCQDSVEVNWDRNPDAEQYDVYMLGNRFMEVVGRTTDTFFVVPNIRYQDENWFAVSSISAGNAISRRTIAIDQQPGVLQSCAGKAPVSRFAVQSDVCANVPLTLADNSEFSPDNFRWVISPSTYQFVGGTNAFSQSPRLTFSLPGTYTIQQIAFGFFGRDTSEQTITVGAAPNVSFSTAINGNSVDFTASATGATAYSWDFGDGNTSTDANPTHTYAQSGQYSVRMTATTPCGNVTTTQTFQFWAVSVDPTSETFGMSVYPNPNEGQFTLQLGQMAGGDITISVKDLIGRSLRVIQDKVNGEQYRKQFNLNDLPAGVYLIQVDAGDTRKTMKIQLQ